MSKSREPNRCRRLLELNSAGERLRQLFDLVDDASRKSRLGQERFPFLGQFGSKISDNRLAASSIMKACPR